MGNQIPSQYCYQHHTEKIANQHLNKQHTNENSKWHTK